MNEVSFRNSYLLMRHGESDANVSGVIVSDPKIGCERFGLTDRGSKQIIASVKGFTGEAITQIVCSDFLRTLQTAQLVANTLNLPQPEQEVGLRERFFGKWEGMSAEHYENIWQRDEMDKHSDDGVEQPQEVAQRGLMVLERLEQQYQGEVILLVSHGDMLQILSTSIAGISPHKHRSLPHHQTGEIKYLVTEHK
jgi:probable phosphoglycerate mutase|tara:strand:+ start:464 stop:1048 length:585 start_codon:yes stop_codon:yes gene_type:complete